MKSLFFKKVYVFVIILIPLIISCGKDSEKIEDYYTVVDSIRLERPVYFYDFKRIKDYFVGIDVDDQQLVMLSSSGELLDTCGRRGRGPNEFRMLQFFDYYDNIIYLLDRGNNKVAIVEIDDKNQRLLYKDEFLLEREPFYICALDRDKVLITLWGNMPNVRLYDSEGKVLGEYYIPEKKMLRTQEDIYNSVYFATKSLDTSGTYILFAGLYNMNLYFCKFNNNDNSIQILKEVKTRFRRKSKASKIIRGDGYVNINIYGLERPFSIDDKFYTSFHPTMLERQRVKSSFFEIYDIEGNYLGDAHLKDHTTSSEYICFSSQADTLWFMPGYDLIYVCEREESK
jgi:hypothetical protein